MYISMKDRQHFSSAVSLAHYGEHRVRVGAVAVVNGKKVAGAFNTFRNDPANTSYRNATYHAEMNCLKQVSERLLSKVTLYVARLDTFNVRKASCPCVYCSDVIKNNIRAVVYLNSNCQLVKERM